jgi:hypothetical protein
MGSLKGTRPQEEQGKVITIDLDERPLSTRLGQTIEQLAEFLEAKEVVYTARVPAAWKNSLR